MVFSLKKKLAITNRQKQKNHRKLKEEALLQLEQIAQTTLKDVMEEIKNAKKIKNEQKKIKKII